MQLLLLSPWFPVPPDNGTKSRVLGLLRALAPAHEVDLLSFVRDSRAEPDSPELRELCATVRTVDWREYRPASLRALAGLLGPRPRWLADTHSPRMAAAIRDLAASRRYAAVIACQTVMASYAPVFAGRPALFEEVELGMWRPRGPGPVRRLRRRLTWAKHRRYLARLLPAFAACTVVSETERALLRTAVARPPRIELVPNAVDLQQLGPPAEDPEPDRLVFCGAMTYAPNREGIEWFLLEIWPAVRAVRPTARLLVTGDPGTARALPRAPGVTFTGHLEDPRPVLAGAWASVVPLRSGGGTRLKILEAMALGVPVVTTPIGAEGLAAVAGRDLEIAERPTEIADRIVRLLEDRAARDSIGAAGRRLVARRYDWRAIGPRFEELVRDVAAA